MTKDTLDIQIFSRAVVTLKRALDEFDRDNSNEFVRDACIQRFEYCYDLATKMIKRHLKLTEDDPSGIEAMTIQERIRRAYDVGILQNSWERWWQFRDDRAATSHGYNLERALEIIAKIPAFYTEANYLAGALSKIYET
jgi:nucleotidyltransferase substrate binding protein (TIGR01987 family)